MKAERMKAPLFEIVSNPTINLSQIKTRRFSNMGVFNYKPLLVEAFTALMAKAVRFKAGAEFFWDEFGEEITIEFLRDSPRKKAIIRRYFKDGSLRQIQPIYNFKLHGEKIDYFSDGNFVAQKYKNGKMIGVGGGNGVAERR